MQVSNIIENLLKMLIAAPDCHVSSIVSAAHFQEAFWVSGFTDLELQLRFEAKFDPPMDHRVPSPVGLSSIIAKFQQVCLNLLMIAKATSDLVAKEFPSFPEVHSRPIAICLVLTCGQHGTKELVEKAFESTPGDGDPTDDKREFPGNPRIASGFFTLLSSNGPK
jgi:hypothetical protein